MHLLDEAYIKFNSVKMRLHSDRNTFQERPQKRLAREATYRMEKDTTRTGSLATWLASWIASGS